jgi:hypothetical protein
MNLRRPGERETISIRKNNTFFKECKRFLLLPKFHESSLVSPFSLFNSAVSRQHPAHSRSLQHFDRRVFPVENPDNPDFIHCHLPGCFADGLIPPTLKMSPG